MIPPPMPMLQQKPKAKVHYSEIKIQHVYKYELLPLPEFKGEEIECELPPYIEKPEAPKQIPVDESPEHFKEIYSYSSNLSGFSIKQYFNAEWKPKIHLGIKNPIVYS